jgi:hypothetical protein
MTGLATEDVRGEYPTTVRECSPGDVIEIQGEPGLFYIGWYKGGRAMVCLSDSYIRMTLLFEKRRCRVVPAVLRVG